MAVQNLSKDNGVEKPLAKKEYPSKSITETLTNGFFTVDQKWIVKYWNREAEKLIGVQAKDIVGKNLWEEFVEVIPIEFYAVQHKAFQKDIPIHFEEYWGIMGGWFDVITYYCDDTLSVSFKCSNTPHSEYPENPTQRLKILTELYKFVTEITNDCLWEWDLKSKEIFWIDGGHKRVFGYQIENALIPQSFWESRLHPDDKERVIQRLNNIISEGSVCEWVDEYRFQRSDGSYTYVNDRGHIIYDADKTAARMIGATKDITEKVLLENQLMEERQSGQRKITAAIFLAQEKEREEVGKELHDNLNQNLAIAKLYTQMAITDKSKKETYLEKSCGLIENVIQEIRRISKKLVIPNTEIIGLFENIKNLVHDLEMIHSLKIKFQHSVIKEEEMDEKLQVTIFRILQEQVNNILKHAGASLATVQLMKHTNNVILNISDNGKGCDLLKEKNGIGIMNIRSRTELYNGKVEIISSPGEGFEMKVEIPLNSKSQLSYINMQVI